MLLISPSTPQDGSKETVRLNNAEELLTAAVKTGCGVEGLKGLPSGNCSSVRLLPATAVVDMAPSDTAPSQVILPPYSCRLH